MSDRNGAPDRPDMILELCEGNIDAGVPPYFEVYHDEELVAQCWDEDWGNRIMAVPQLIWLAQELVQATENQPLDSRKTLAHCAELGERAKAILKRVGGIG